MTVGEAVSVAVAQFAPVSDTAANIGTITGLVEAAAARGAQVVVLPEYSSFFMDPFDRTLADHAEDIGGPFTAALVGLASRTGTHLVAGLLERANGGRVRNAVIAVSGEGVHATYRKLHLYDAFGQRESDWVEPGRIAPPETFTVGDIRFGIMTCYDLRFPEVGRLLADAGATAFLVPAEWVRGPLKEHHWQTLLQARAIENTVYVAAADHPPPLGVGLSGIIDPQGVVVAAVGTGTDVALAQLDPAALSRVRRINPALALRRFATVPREEG